jgi:hypothetical protein
MIAGSVRIVVAFAVVAVGLVPGAWADNCTIASVLEEVCVTTDSEDNVYVSTPGETMSTDLKGTCLRVWTSDPSGPWGPCVQSWGGYALCGAIYAAPEPTEPMGCIGLRAIPQGSCADAYVRVIDVQEHATSQCAPAAITDPCPTGLLHKGVTIWAEQLPEGYVTYCLP